MTWTEYIDARAAELGDARDRSDFEQRLDALEADLATYKNVPDDFWDLLRKAYKRAPKLLLKEAQAAASLNALLTIADSLIAQRSSASGKK